MSFIRRIREGLEQTQSQFSKALNIPQSRLSYLETHSDPSLRPQLLARLYKTSKLSSDEFMGLIVREAQRQRRRDKERR
jgi:transcriptional regulator with XRE-family HTH domain